MINKHENVGEMIRKNMAYKKTTNPTYEILKRIIDFTGGVIGLVVFFLVFLILYILYNFGENKGPVLFKQKRLGKNGVSFNIYKFRSMKVNAEKILLEDKKLYGKYVHNGYKLEIDEDPRVTKLGKFIRKTSIDELPQFINVIRGEMSLVGPRPIVLNELTEYGDRKELFLSMKPGITGVWQTSGRSNIGYPQRVEVELSYLNNQSLRKDFGILLKTILKVFSSEGAY